jgi:hypothetical protein
VRSEETERFAAPQPDQNFQAFVEFRGSYPIFTVFSKGCEVRVRRIAQADTEG